LKPKVGLRIGLDLTGADRSPQELALAIPRLRERFPQHSFHVFWPLQVPIPDDVVGSLSSVIHQDRSSASTSLHRILRRLMAIARRSAPKEAVHGECQLLLMDQTIGMDEEPLAALRRSPRSALPMMVRELREGVLDLAISSGNTGALIAAGQLGLPKKAGCKRLALAARIPTQGGRGSCVLVDCGATLEPTADQLLRFTEWGIEFAVRALGQRSLRVGLLNIGAEAIKGPPALKDAHRRLVAGEVMALQHHRFLGNVEPRSVWAGEADLVVATGLMGNLYLKSIEAFMEDSNPGSGAAAVLGVHGHLFKLHGRADAQDWIHGVEEALTLCSQLPHEHLASL
jgi:fatty acid/phospholipid biosynthesis enzyme